jgi:RNA polymerase sigma factor (sigma-70 family)
MSNEELALSIQAGNTDTLLDLWEQVKRLCQVMIRRYYGIATANRAIDADDLMQCAFLGMCRAVSAYRPDEGAFSTILGFYVRNECRAALGLAGREHQEIFGALSMDAPIGAEGDTLTLADTVEDDSLPEITESLEAQDMRREVWQAVDALPDQQAHVISENYFTSRTLQQIADGEGLSVSRVQAIKTKAFRGLRRNRTIRNLYNDCAYFHKGLTAFKTSFSSVVEDAVLKIEEHRALLAQSLWANYTRHCH